MTEPWPADEGARRADALFRRAFGGAPDGVWSAPGRVNLIGEHTDHNGGLCLPVAIGHRAYVALRARKDGSVRVVSAQHPGDRPATLAAPITPARAAAEPGWPAYVFGVAAMLRARLAGTDPTADAHPPAAVPGADITVDSCVPQGAGLSSSAALECAAACALADAAGADIGDPSLRRALVDATRTAENEVVGVPSGAMDQSAALLASAGHALLLDCGDGLATPVPFDVAALSASLLIIDTRTTHALVDGGYATRRAECAAAERALGVRNLSGAVDADVAGLADPLLRARARHVLTENARVRAFVRELASTTPSAQRLGALLDASHASLRDDFAVSTRELDLAATAAREAGAFGARMVGAGFGGAVLALGPDGDAARIAARVTVAFRAAGLPAPACYPAQASAPAGRER
ncbi:galactokinase [Tomitella fengzijianii]|uniref:Galactokinase n=1 Tax=Tomitella fengzijianii TaxID=2597660 RepID=A0A516X858_9ACTN|nr:galactokinase [Tomitella fengzijianii]